MSTDINQVTIVGRLTKDMELRYLASGTAVGNFSIACSEDTKQYDNSYAEKAHFFDCTLWSKQAESLNQYLVKGKQVAIVGRLKQETWQDQATGQNRHKVVINVSRIQLLGGGRDQGQQGAPQRGYNQAPPQSGYQYPPHPQTPAQGQQQAPPPQYDSWGDGNYNNGPESFQGDVFDNDQIPF